MNSSYILVFLLVIFFAFSCRTGKYEQRTAYVYKTEPYHWGRGYYKQDIFFRFEYEGDTIEAIFRYPQLYSIAPVTTGIVNTGDSVRIEFPSDNPHKAKVISYTLNLNND